MKAWMRILTVKLSNGKNSLLFGDNDEATSYNFDINISGYKYMSSLKDTCTIKISNLAYDIVVQMIRGNYYDIEVNCGYKSFGTIKIFKGSVLYISDILESDRTHTVVILCSSSLLAKYGQSRINLTMHGNMNMHTVISYLSRKAGIKSAHISNSLKGVILQNSLSGSNSAASWIENFTTNNKMLITESSGLDNAAFSIYNAAKTKNRAITINSSFINLDGGYPKLTKEGLNFSVMPTFSFMCGDTIKIDPSLIDISITSKEEISNNIGYYLDEEGYYVIYSMTYNLTNHEQNFNIDLNCKSYSRISNFINVK